jgi:cell division protein FtsB
MGKTETIKDRRVDVYLDTLERKERWKQLADEEGESLSKFVQKCVEYALEQGGVDYAELSDRAKKIQELEEELTELRKEVKQKDTVIEKLESDLRKYRMEPFTEGEFQGTREFDQELIEILQRSTRVTGRELRNRLDIDPNETELMQALDKQLQQLEGYGLVESTTNGWRWTG